MWSRSAQLSRDCFPRYERGESGADGKMLLLLLPPSEPSRPLHNGKLSGGNLSLALSSLSAPTQSQARLRSIQLLLSLLSCSPARPALSHHSTARPAFPFNFSFYRPSRPNNDSWRRLSTRNLQRRKTPITIPICRLLGWTCRKYRIYTRGRKTLRSVANLLHNNQYLREDEDFDFACQCYMHYKCIHLTKGKFIEF